MAAEPKRAAEEDKSQKLAGGHSEWLALQERSKPRFDHYIEELLTFWKSMEYMKEDSLEEYDFDNINSFIVNKSKKLAEIEHSILCDLSNNEILANEHYSVLYYFGQAVRQKIDHVYTKFSMAIENEELRKLLDERGGNNPDAPPTIAVSGTDEPPQLRSFAERLDHYRRAAGLTQRQLAERAELTRSNVSNLEAGKWEPRLNTILKLAETLNIDPCALLPKQTPRQR